MRIAFKAVIKKIEPLTLECGDLQATITLKLNDENITEEIMTTLTKLWQKVSPERVTVVIMDNKEADEISG